MQDFGSRLGGGTGTESSPEAVRGVDALHDRETGPPPRDPEPRPGCLRTVLSFLAVLIAAAVLLYLLGLATGIVH
jgi:hypothetical protein